MDHTALNHTAWNPLHSIGIHCTMMHGIHFIQLRSIGPRCIESTALNGDPFSHAALYTLRSIRMHFTTLHGIHGIQSGCLWPCCKKSTSFNHAEGIHCIQSCCIKSPAFNRVPFLHAAWNPLHSIMLHGIHSI